MDSVLAELVEKLVPQAKAIAYRRYQKAPHILERDELEGIALDGLMDAAHKWPGYCAKNSFDPADAVKGYFAAYAIRRMNGAILDYLRSLDWVPRSVRSRAKRIDAAHASGAVTAEELAAEASMTIAEVHATNAALARRPVSLDEGDRDVPERQDVEGQARVAELLQAVRETGDRLPRLQRVVLALRYYEEIPLPQIAELLSLDRAQVLAAHDDGARTVREAMLTAV